MRETNTPDDLIVGKKCPQCGTEMIYMGKTSFIDESSTPRTITYRYHLDCWDCMDESGKWYTQSFSAVKSYHIIPTATGNENDYLGCAECGEYKPGEWLREVDGEFLCDVCWRPKWDERMRQLSRKKDNGQ